jgi:hypothetical protein
MANPLTAKLSELFEKLQGPGGSTVYKDPKIQELYNQFLKEQGTKIETPRISTTPESIENFGKATTARQTAQVGDNKIALDYAWGIDPLKDKGSRRRTDEYGRQLDHRVDAYRKMQGGSLGLAEQIQHDRTNVTLPAFMALEEKRIDNARTDALLGRLLQGAGTLGILFS